jgi:hypothetical protein
MIIAIHQPNYFPWLGYFHKIAVADQFIFLDDVQYSKNSYTNRVQIRNGDQAKWMTVPISYNFGDAINAVHPAKQGWVGSHLDQLRGAYGDASCFAETWTWLKPTCERFSGMGDLASVNRELVEAVAQFLDLECRFSAASDHNVGDKTGEERIIALVKEAATDATYLSGSGATDYQEEANFQAAGITLRYGQFQHPQYDQGDNEFMAGLSILDPLFYVGREKTAALLREGTASE